MNMCHMISYGLSGYHLCLILLQDIHHQVGSSCHSTLLGDTSENVNEYGSTLILLETYKFT